jgi:hypothetical protein
LSSLPLLFVAFAHAAHGEGCKRLHGSALARQLEGVSEMRTGETRRFLCCWCKRLVWAVFAGHSWLCSECGKPIL